jgi:F-type H+-transporting ATPase subunit b
MNINVSLIGQAITFIILIWFTMRFVWPPVTNAMTARQKKIADGLEAAERGVRELETAQHQVLQIVNDAKMQATGILEEANKRATLISEEAREKAREEGNRILDIARGEIAQEAELAKQKLRHDLAALITASVERILEQKMDNKNNEQLVERLLTEI